MTLQWIAHITHFGGAVGGVDGEVGGKGKVKKKSSSAIDLKQQMIDDDALAFHLLSIHANSFEPH